MNKILKKLPIGEPSFKNLIEGDCLYVDKTKYIYNIVTENRYYFLSRPRRFGKSLLISTMKEIFSGNKELFKDCWIYNSDYNWKKFPIIHLDFGDKKQELRKNFYDVLLNALKEIALFYKLTINDNSVTGYFSSLIIELYKKEGQIVFLVDEYDKPILDSIDDLNMANENREILRGIFSTAKSLAEFLRITFVTGVTQFTQVSLFSGPNHLRDISRVSDYNSLLGYTQKELELYFNDYIVLLLEEKNINTKDIKELYNKIKKRYNGYSFTEFVGDETIYNPFSILNFIKNKSFSNYWFKSGTPKFLITLLNKNNYQPIRNENNILTKISDLDKFDINRINIQSLLFQTGYLTIESYDDTTRMIKLKYPNEEVRDSFISEIEERIKERFDDNLKDHVFKLRLYLKEENWNELFELIKICFSNIVYPIKPRTEDFYASMFSNTFFIAGFQIDSEVRTNIGCIDMALYANNKIYIIEFKHNYSSQGAIDQIRSTKYYEKYLLEGMPIVLIGINFNSFERNINEWKVENL